MTRRALTVLFLTAAMTCAATHPAAPASIHGASIGWETLPGRDVAILYHPGDELYANRVLAICEARAPVIASTMGLRTISPLRVAIASTDDEFAELTHFGAPDWGVGCALSREGLIVLKSPRIVGYPLQMESVVEHEVAHIAVGRMLRGIPVPRWFHEGIAQTVAGQWRASEVTGLARAAAGGTLPRLSDLEVGFPEGQQAAATAYAMSFQAVRLLMERSGAKTPGQLVTAIAASGDFDSAVRGLTGWSSEQLDDEFARFVARRFNVGTVLSDDRVLFAALSVAFIAIVAVRLARTRARMREWEEDESEVSDRVHRSELPRDSRWS